MRLINLRLAEGVFQDRLRERVFPPILIHRSPNFPHGRNRAAKRIAKSPCRNGLAWNFAIRLRLSWPIRQLLVTKGLSRRLDRPERGETGVFVKEIHRLETHLAEQIELIGYRLR